MIPFPYIANTTGWYTAELGRQPWLVYNITNIRWASPTVSSGNTLFTLLGFIGLYLLLGMLFLILVGKIINKDLKQHIKLWNFLVYSISYDVNHLCYFRWL